MGIVYAVLNQGGGVGKSELAKHLAEILTEPSGSGMRENNVVLIDADPQGHSTEALGLTDEWMATGKPTLYDALIDPEEIDPVDLIRTPKNDRLMLIPSNASMMDIESDLVSAPSNETRLLDLNRRLRRVADYIVIDSPSYFGKLTNNILGSVGIPLDRETGKPALPRTKTGALTPASEDLLRSGLIIPVTAEPKSVRALDVLLKHVKRIQRVMKIRVNILGLVASNVGRNTSISSGILKDYHSILGDRVFSGQIDNFVGYLEAFQAGQTLFSYQASTSRKKEIIREHQQVFREIRAFIQERAEANYQAFLKEYETDE